MVPSARLVLMRRLAFAGWDAFAWLFASLVLLAARYDFELSDVQWTLVGVYVVLAILLQLTLGFLTHLYRGRNRIGSFDEAVQTAFVVALVAIAAGAPMLFVTEFPRGLVISVPPSALILMSTGRWIFRASRERYQPHASADAETTLIYGAGDAGAQVYRLNHLAEESPFNIVGFIDDDPLKRSRRFGHVKVLGNGHDMWEIAKAKDATTIILAITHVDGAFIKKLSDRATAEGIRLLVLPPLRDMMRGKVHLGQLHQVDVTDILGRKPIKTDLRAISDYLNNRVVLVTGAGGSIGSEIAKQVKSFGPSKLILLDRDESALHGVQLQLYGQGLLDTDDMALASIRDPEALDGIFAHHKPDVVFHAAALKHLPMLEQYPLEGWKTNVLGTANVLEAARKYGCRHFVNISTDKAADPTSVLGKTKRLAEQMTAWHAQDGAGKYLSVRFGNVLGSRGSMLHTFNAQIEQGGPITVTHRDVERFFMTIPEACELTIQAGAIGEPGDVLVLNMGTPIKILDVAERLIENSGKDIEIKFTGLRPGEKLSEVLFSENEAATPSSHPLINHVQVPPADPKVIVNTPASAINKLTWLRSVDARRSGTSEGPVARGEGAR